ncbi:MAG TPA: 50S ribosomal protein L9 [Candidatus Acidoferrum sp.]|nr:50S ribosomal protein L9 [Candidatus Acidoferrum sp.]
MPMQLILTQDVPHLGKAGELVTVKSGFGRNYLVPRGMAVSATAENKAELDHRKRQVDARVAKDRATAAGIADRIGGMTLQFERLVGEDERMFGSVTSRDLARQLEVAGVDIDSRQIELGEPIKSIGKHEVPVRLGAGTVATLKFWVTAKAKE